MTVINRIKPEPVKRNKSGFWTHSQFPIFDEGDYLAFVEWQQEQQVETQRITFEDDAHDGLQDAWQNTGFANCQAWEPSMPEGNGWFMLVIFDTDDGPVCYWVRYQEDALDDDEEE